MLKVGQMRYAEKHRVYEMFRVRTYYYYNYIFCSSTVSYQNRTKNLLAEYLHLHNYTYSILIILYLFNRFA